MVMNDTRVYGYNMGADVSNSSLSSVTPNGTSDDGFQYAGAESLYEFSVWYRGYHGYLAVVVCVFGIIANVLNIVVLTRKNMVSSTNCILTGLAVSDGLTMMAYLPFALRFYCLYGTEPTVERNTLEAIRFLLFYACFSVVVHTVSIWLTVTLAVFRYIFITHPRMGAELCSLKRAKLAVFLVYLVTLIACIPNFVTITVKGEPVESNNNTIERLWIVDFKSDTATEKFIYNLNFWVQATLIKIVPCVGLSILSILLVMAMREADERRKNLRKGRSDDDNSRDRKTNRTTRMLLTVVVLFLCTEFPQGILSLLSGLLDESFVAQIYGPLGDLIDILTLINNSVNFLLYCTMSKQFRDTFIEIFIPRWKKDNRRFSLVPTNAHTENTVVANQSS